MNLFSTWLCGALLFLVQGCVRPPADVTFTVPGATAPIVHGEPCEAWEFPSAGAILTRGYVGGSERAGMVCSGVLIAPDAVLTAGHCTEIESSFFGGQGQDIETFFTLAPDVQFFGRSSSMPPGPFRQISQLIAHPDYDRANFALYPVGLARLADIGVGLLQEAFDDAPTAVLSAADLGGALQPDLVVDIVGYGRPAVDAADGIKLKARSIVNEINATEVQVGDALPTPVTCLGDSGGPTYLQLDDGQWPSRRLLAVTSRAYDASVCEVGGVATRCDAFRDWIDQTLRAACLDGLRDPAQCEGGGGLARPVPVTQADGGPGPDDETPGCDCRGLPGYRGMGWAGLLPWMAARRRREPR